MCTTMNPQMLRSGALNPAGGRGPDNTRPRRSPEAESDNGGAEPKYGTGIGGQSGYARMAVKPAPAPEARGPVTKQMRSGGDGDPYQPTAAQRRTQRQRDRNKP